ncbi:F-box protein [uncultured Nostoc sp.]|uniref:F-box protein n=1 Tax=uncultured Nostoc sp. TaxID=340711 RepID=UPI0035CA1A08
MPIPPNLLDLPPETILNILSYVDVTDTDRANFALTSRRAALIVREFNRHANDIFNHQTSGMLDFLTSLKGHTEL